MTTSSQGLRPAAVFRSSSGLGQTALNRARKSSQGTTAFRTTKRVLLGIETAIALAEVEETRLTHSCPSLRNQHAALSSNSHARKRSIFRGALKLTQLGSGEVSRALNDELESGNGVDVARDERL